MDQVDPIGACAEIADRLRKRMLQRDKAEERQYEHERIEVVEYRLLRSEPDLTREAEQGFPLQDAQGQQSHPPGDPEPAEPGQELDRLPLVKPDNRAEGKPEDIAREEPAGRNRREEPSPWLADPQDETVAREVDSRLQDGGPHKQRLPPRPRPGDQKRREQIELAEKRDKVECRRNLTECDRPHELERGVGPPLDILDPDHGPRPGAVGG